MPEQATQSTLEGNFKLVELLYYHSKCVPIFRACREGTCLTLLWPSSTPGLKTEHLVYKCINYLTQRTKSGAQIWSSALSKFQIPSLPVLPVLPPGGTLYSTWILSQIWPLGITCIWDCIINLYLGREVLTCDFQLFCVFLQTFCKSYAVKHTYHPLSACHWKMTHPNTEWNDLKIGLLSN